MIIKSARFNKTYNLNNGELIGQGNFAQVYKIYDSDLKKFIAIRRVAKEDAEPEDVAKQKKINQQLQKVKNPHILEIFQIIDVGDLVWYLTEYCEGGSLWDALNQAKGHRFSEVETLQCVLQIAKGVQELHNHRITHRDLKPENILLTKKYKKGAEIPHLKIADFGLSTKNIIMSTVAGTKEYIAPEQAKFHTYTNAVDVWSIGVIFDQMLHGEPYYTGQNNKEVFDKILKLDYKVRDSSISEPVKQLLLSILKKRAYERPIIATIKSRIEQILAASTQPDPPHPQHSRVRSSICSSDRPFAAERQLIEMPDDDQSRPSLNMIGTSAGSSANELKEFKIPIFKQEKKKVLFPAKQKSKKEEVTKNFIDIDTFLDEVRAQKQQLYSAAAFKVQEISFNPNSKVVGIEPVLVQTPQGVSVSEPYLKFTELKREFDYLNQICEDEAYEIKLLQTKKSLSRARETLEKSFRAAKQQVGQKFLQQIDSYIDELVNKSFV